MTSRESLNIILELKVLSLLTSEGFKSNSNKSTFKRKINNVIQIIQLVASNNNHKGLVEKYSLNARTHTPEFPGWYIQTYNTTQTIHHQTQINEKMIGAPNSKFGYKENWDSAGQIGFGYDLLSFEQEVISESIYHNLSSCILPNFKMHNSYAKIASNANTTLRCF